MMGKGQGQGQVGRERGPHRKGAGANGTDRVFSEPVQAPVLLFFHFSYNSSLKKAKQLKAFLRLSFPL